VIDLLTSLFPKDDTRWGAIDPVTLNAIRPKADFCDEDVDRQTYLYRFIIEASDDSSSAKWMRGNFRESNALKPANGPAIHVARRYGMQIANCQDGLTNAAYMSGTFNFSATARDISPANIEVSVSILKPASRNMSRISWALLK
jgi:hypothetical protein